MVNNSGLAICKVQSAGLPVHIHLQMSCTVNLPSNTLTNENY